MRDAGGREEGGEDLEGKSPRNNPRCQSEFHLLPGSRQAQRIHRPGASEVRLSVPFLSALTCVSFLKTILELKPKLRNPGKLLMS